MTNTSVSAEEDMHRICLADKEVRNIFQTKTAIVGSDVCKCCPVTFSDGDIITFSTRGVLHIPVCEMDLDRFSFFNFDGLLVVEIVGVCKTISKVWRGQNSICFPLLFRRFGGTLKVMSMIM